MFTAMAERLQEEVDLMMSLAQLQGALHMIMSCAEIASQPSSATVKSNQSMEPSNAAQTERDLILNIT